MKIILSGGGTGGHVNPALAIGAAVIKHVPDVELYYFGTPKGIENKLVPKQYAMQHIDVQGLKRSLSPKNIRTVRLTFNALNKCARILKKLQPDAVIGTGGYVCYPVCAAAAQLGISTFLHESNAVPGFAVKMLEKRADVIFVNFAETADKLPGAKETLHVGTPLRSDFYTCTKESARSALSIDEKYHKVVLSFGGSLGAGTLNDEVLALMEHYGSTHPHVLFLHATGSAGYETFKKAFEEKELGAYDNLRYSEYIYDMPKYMAAADVVICRSGAMTLSELAVLGKPSILIPSPNVTNDQQTKNAKLLSDRDSAILLPETDLHDGALRRELAALLEDDEKLARFSENVKAFAVRDAEQVIYEKIAEVIAKKKKKK